MRAPDAAGGAPELRAADPETSEGAERPGAIVLMIGDGMGISQITFSRNYYLEADESLAMDRMPVTALMSTHSSSNWVTDSAAAATALASGVKITNGRIGLDDTGTALRTISDEAKAKGWRIGYVTDTSITHATPAGFYGHVRDRYLQQDIDALADQLLEQGPDVALGGGRRDFEPIGTGGGKRLDKRNLLEIAKEGGYAFYDHSTGLPEELELPALGLFGGGHLPYELDRELLPEALRPPRLRELTQSALAALGADNSPFFLMIEGGRIDHGAHSFDAASVAAQTRSFDQAVQTVLDYQRERPDLLVVVTADHATGGLAINDFVDWPLIARQSATIEWMVARIMDQTHPATVAEINELIGYDALDDEVLATLREAPEKYAMRRALGTHLALKQGVTWVPRIEVLETKGHTGEDVPLYASGPGARRLQGVLDNTEVPSRLIELIGWQQLNDFDLSTIDLPNGENSPIPHRHDD